MAINTITTSIAQGSNFIPQIWGTECMQVLRKHINLAKTVSTNYDYSQDFNRGNILNIGYVGALTANDVVGGNIANTQQPTGQLAIAVTLNQYKSVDLALDNIMAVQADVNLMKQYSAAAAEALADKVETYLFGLITGAGLTIGSNGTGFSESLARKARTALQNASAPYQDRHLLLTPQALSDSLGDANLNRFFASARPEDVENGTLAKIYSMDVHESRLYADASQADAQTLTVTGTPTGGNTVVSVLGGTFTLPYNATAASAQTLIQAVPQVGAGNCTVSGGPLPGTPLVFTFGGLLGGQKIPTMTTADAYSGGSSPASAVAHTTSGGSTNVAYHKNAIVLATRPLPAVSAGVDSAVVVDTESGLTIRITSQYSVPYKSTLVSWEILFGASVARADQMVQILS